VAETGPGVTGLAPGDRVVVNPFVACGECPACAAGRETECPNLRVVGEHLDGTYAQYIATVGKSILSARRGGRVVGMGSHTGSLVELDLRSIYQREITLIGSHLANRAEITEFLPLLADGTLHPVVDSVFGLKDAAAAHARLADPERFGQVVLTIPGADA
jgi:D-arabinose 1-dehydrogenase-like Zn-dependent alcohol dehydrogenase